MYFQQINLLHLGSLASDKSKLLCDVNPYLLLNPRFPYCICACGYLDPHPNQQLSIPLLVYQSSPAHRPNPVDAISPELGLANNNTPFGGLTTWIPALCIESSKHQEC